MKILITSLFILAGSAAVRAQIPVTDLASITNAEIEHVENIAKWAESIAQLKTQIDQLRQQINIQSDIRQWAGDPKDAARRIALDQLGVANLVKEYGHAHEAIVSATGSLDSLAHTATGTYRAIEATDIDGGTVRLDPLVHRRYSVLNAQQDNYQQVFDDTKEREAELEDDLAQTLIDLKEASTDAEVHKQAAKVEAINGQLAAISAQRRDQIDQVVAQKIANDARLEQERQAAAELESKDNYLANQRVTAFMSSIRVRKAAP